MTEASFEDFLKLDIRCGTIVAATPFPEARKPAYKLEIDFGAPLGTRKSSAQITTHYQLDELMAIYVRSLDAWRAGCRRRGRAGHARSAGARWWKTVLDR